MRFQQVQRDRSGVVGLQELGALLAQLVAFLDVDVALLFRGGVELVELLGDQGTQRGEDMFGYLHAAVCVQIIEDGGPRWLHLVVLISLWSALKLLWLWPVGVAVLVRIRLREARAHRRDRIERESWEEETAEVTALRWCVRRSTPTPRARGPRPNNDNTRSVGSPPAPPDSSPRCGCTASPAIGRACAFSTSWPPSAGSKSSW